MPQCPGMNQTTICEKATLVPLSNSTLFHNAEFVQKLTEIHACCTDKQVICTPYFDLFYKHNMVKKVTINFVLQIFC